MDSPPSWLAIAVGLSALGAVVVGGMALFRMRARARLVTSDERAEMAATPMSPLQKIAWAGLGVGVLQSLGIGAIFATQGGAAVYWEDDRMRLQVIGVFIGGLVLSAVLHGLAQFKADEREHAVLAWGPRIQSAAVLVTLALGNIFLAQRFHDEGAIPVVYSYLGFGVVFIVHMTANFVGILLGFGATRLHGQG